MGGWFVATAVGGYLSGLVGVWWERLPHSRFFLFLLLTSLGAAAVLFLLYGRLRAAMPAERRPAAEAPRDAIKTAPTAIVAAESPP
jgi:hypothetical protein